jgi:hypothetical protein
MAARSPFQEMVEVGFSGIRSWQTQRLPRSSPVGTVTRLLVLVVTVGEIGAGRLSYTDPTYHTV